MMAYKSWRSELFREIRCLLAQKEVVPVETDGRICWEIDRRAGGSKILQTRTCIPLLPLSPLAATELQALGYVAVHQDAAAILNLIDWTKKLPGL